MKIKIIIAYLAWFACAAVTAKATQRFVSLNTAFPVSPYISWATAATNIQDAVNAATAGDEVTVSNGVYSVGATAVYGSNRVAVTKALFLHSVNGPAVTTIRGYQMPGITNGPAAVRCIYLATGAVLAGFTLSGGATQVNNDNYFSLCGGGALSDGNTIISNCDVVANSASDSGGGAFGATLNNCTLVNNTAVSIGGGAEGCILKNDSWHVIVDRD